MSNHVRVVIVDDQAPFRDAATAVVETMPGYAVVGSAASGEDGLALTQELRPDVLLLDVNLPGMSGVEVARVLAGESTSTAVVLVSTYDVTELAEDVADCGAAGYLRKSDFGADRLLEVLAGERG